MFLKESLIMFSNLVMWFRRNINNQTLCVFFVHRKSSSLFYYIRIVHAFEYWLVSVFMICDLISFVFTIYCVCVFGLLHMCLTCVWLLLMCSVAVIDSLRCCCRWLLDCYLQYHWYFSNHWMKILIFQWFINIMINFRNKLFTED